MAALDRASRQPQWRRSSGSGSVNDERRLARLRIAQTRLGPPAHDYITSFICHHTSSCTLSLPLCPPLTMTDSALASPAPPASSPLRCVEALQMRERQFVESLAAQWQSSVQGSPDSAATTQLTSQLIPILVAALAELGLRVEQEAGLQAAHDALRRTNPLVQPRSGTRTECKSATSRLLRCTDRCVLCGVCRAELNPLTWLASYLMRNNPRYAEGEHRSAARPHSRPSSTSLPSA